MQEQLQLFLDALKSYDDAIALGTRDDERKSHAREDVLRGVIARFPGARRVKRTTCPLPGRAWRGTVADSASSSRCLAAAQYKSAQCPDVCPVPLRRLVLGFSEVVVAQWNREQESRGLTSRDSERELLRKQLIPRLERVSVPSLQWRGPPLTRSGNAETGALLNAVLRRETSWRMSRSCRGHRAKNSSVCRPSKPISRYLIKEARGIAGKRPACRDVHSDFAKRITSADALMRDQRPASLPQMRSAVQSLQGSIALCCQDQHRQWGDIKERLRAILRRLVRPPRSPFLGSMCSVLKNWYSKQH